MEQKEIFRIAQVQLSQATFQIAGKTADWDSYSFWKFPESKDPANRAIAEFYTICFHCCNPDGIGT